MIYSNGENVCMGDRVRYSMMEGEVEIMLVKGSQVAIDYNCVEEDAVVIRILNNNDRYVLVPHEEEDLELVARK